MAQMGMDVEAVESVGRQLKQSAASVDQIVATLDRTVSGLSSQWDGPDAQRFAQSWPTFRKSLLVAQASVAGLGQSALNNASEQREASGAKGGPIVGPSTPPNHEPTPHPGVATTFDKNSEQHAYDSRSSGTTPAYFMPGGEGHGQCTSWVNFRREQLVQDGLISGPVPTSWQEGHFYPGPVSSDPTPYAVGSFTNGNHTFVVESVSDGSPRTISISEMNVGKMVNPALSQTTGLGTVSTATYTEVSAGVWKKEPGGQVDHLTFGA